MTHCNAADKPVLITGGAGFIGTNLAHRLLSEGKRVLILDNLAREGVQHNLEWLRRRHGEALQIHIADITDGPALETAVTSAGRIYHFAAQVAVTTSLTSPAEDFDVNLKGTFMLLEQIRKMKHPPGLVFTSTNKVYGNLEDIPLHKNGGHYEPIQQDLATRGIDENRPLEFVSPYGCSKGAADQYVLDYARTFGLPAVVYRMSCIYGPHQFGTEDQGWVAHFMIRALEHQPITVYGSGFQVRDVLFVEDLVDALLLAQDKMAAIAGRAFNIGGGPGNRISILEMIRLISDTCRCNPRLLFSDWRKGDQKYYVSDIAQFSTSTGWSPKVDISQGIHRLNEWLMQERRKEAYTIASSEVSA
ncbi:MAG: SDR family NAD(P)-dependent oxidoreductase [Desulfobacterales bacterium]